MVEPKTKLAGGPTQDQCNVEVDALIDRWNRRPMTMLAGSKPQDHRAGHQIRQHVLKDDN